MRSRGKTSRGNLVSYFSRELNLFPLETLNKDLDLFLSLPSLSTRRSAARKEEEEYLNELPRTNEDLTRRRHTSEEKKISCLENNATNSPLSAMCKIEVKIILLMLSIGPHEISFHLQYGTERH